MLTGTNFSRHVLLGRSSPWKCFPFWKVSEMPRPSSTTTPVASENTSISTFYSRSALCYTYRLFFPDQYLCNLQWEIHCCCFLLTVCPLGGKRGCCRNIAVQIPPWEVQGGFPGENCFDVTSHTCHRNIFETSIYYQLKSNTRHSQLASGIKIQKMSHVVCTSY